MSIADSINRLIEDLKKIQTDKVVVDRHHLSNLLSSFIHLDNCYTQMYTQWKTVNEQQPEFTYFESTKGGMECIFDIRDPESDLKCLYGWMDSESEAADRQLLEWTKTARIGEGRAHRLGYMVRVLPEDRLPSNFVIKTGESA